MFKTFDQDRYYIERKYHIPEEPFNSYARWNYHGYAYDEGTGVSDEEMQEGLKALREKIKDEPHPIQKAKYFASALKNIKVQAKLNKSCT